MSPLDTLRTTRKSVGKLDVTPRHDREPLAEVLYDILDRVHGTIAPVWPLKDYVAINPYAGISQRRFLHARRLLRSLSDSETLMSLDYYAQQYRRGSLELRDIELAIEEMRQDCGDDTPSHLATDIVSRLQADSAQATAASAAILPASVERRLKALSECLDEHMQSEWTTTVCEEIAKYCAAHYDEGQAIWASPFRHLPLYQAWRSAARHDRNLECLGISGFRRFVAELPQTPEAAIVFCLQRLGVPQRMWEAMLLCQALTIPGWSAWAKYQVESAHPGDAESTDLTGLLAMRLAYDAALAETFDFHVNWTSMAGVDYAPVHAGTDGSSDDVLLRYTLLRASEIAFRRQLLQQLKGEVDATGAERQPGSASPVSSPRKSARKLAQLVFCIDVRSERIRRHLEAESPEIETGGFAGFFGLPIEFVPLGQTHGSRHVPVLLSPQFQLHEGLRSSDLQTEAEAMQRRSLLRTLRKAWKGFQSSAASCFTFVETSGLFYAAKLLARSAGMASAAVGYRFDGVPKHERERLGPTLRDLNRQGITTSRQADLAESILRGMGLTQDFARLVVFCGHGSQTENNPLQAGLDCGACGGHSGEANARLAAMLLNQHYVRQTLADRGISIPQNVHFLAALHNTTTDDVEFFDLCDVPPTHVGDVRKLAETVKRASEHTRRERLPQLSARNAMDLQRRSRDWSEIRPEWGLAGNAAFIAAPRSFTDSTSLDGRAFLHNYDHRLDPQGTILEQIMTAPMMVAHWINMQYYASTVDPRRFGSGTKTVHNVVGRFGLFSGNGGDLMTGLPWESLHNGHDYQHVPLRLLAVIAAPRAMIERVIQKHEVVENLLRNDWLHLIAVEGCSFVRYTGNQCWQELPSGMQQAT